MVNSSMISRAKFSCGRAFVFAPAIQPHEHGGIFRHLDEQIAEVRKRVVAEELELAAQPRGMLDALRRHHPRRFRPSDASGNLAVRRGEVVVPEQRHLFLQRPPGIHHAEQPPLAGVVDDRGGRKRLARREPRIDIVRNTAEIDELVDGGSDAPLAVAAASAAVAPKPARRSRC